MTVRRPSKENLRDIGRRYHLDLTEAEVEDYFTVISGLMSVYDAVDHSIQARSGERHSRKDRRYVALWSEARTGEVFLFDQAVRTGTDIGHALVALERIAPHDVRVLLDQAPDLARHFAAATSEGFDDSKWRRATRAAVRSLIQVDNLRKYTGAGEGGGVQQIIFCPPCLEAGTIPPDYGDGSTNGLGKIDRTTPVSQPGGLSIDDIVVNIIETACCRPSDCPCNSDAQCDDGVFCNGSEWCSCTCRSGSPPQCPPDGIDCTLDGCGLVGDSCAHVPNDNLCPDDGNFCNGEEYCDPVMGCSSRNEPECDDPVDCTKDICSLILNSCQHLPIDDSCPGEQVCNVFLGCVVCTADFLCDDEVFCNGVETCDVAAGICRPDPLDPCDDGIDCTLDACSENQGCGHQSVDSECMGGLVCSSSFGCVECTTDAHCDDDQFCSGVETCNELECQPGTLVDCDDEVLCTIDACHEDTDTCSNTPYNPNCPPGMVCDSELGCVIN